ncbi:Crp/Fnr family transcriptional regulator [Actinoplanes sp. NPDC024001]|uniref:Crp/Fnr family transcriptional regulator n=1 Tax=Actinoplanes sp. NPDC024001 TaxID=3154598 RepID=UPI0033F12926
MHEVTAPDWPAGTLLARLSRPTADALLRLGNPKRVPPGSVLIREGDEESHVFVIQHGLTKVTAETAKGRPALLSIRVSGDLLGELSALSGTPRSATVTMCGPRPGLVRVVRGRDFGRFLTDHPDAAVDLAATVGERLRWSNQRRIDFTSYPVRTRVARVLSELAGRHGTPARHGALEIGVRLTQPELAALSGAAEISVQKALRELRRAGLLSTGYGRITVRDPAALQDIAELSADPTRAG